MKTAPARLLADAFVAPDRALPAAVERRGAVVPLLALAAASAAAAALAAVVAANADWAGAVLAKAGADALTPHDLDAKIEQARKLGVALAWAGALLGPALAAGGAAVALALGFRLAGARPTVGASFTVAALAQLPLALRDLATIPAVLRHAPVRPEDVPRLLPSSLAALLPGAQGPLALAAAALDLFSLWAVALAALGMARAARVPGRRALLVTAALWLAWIAVFRVSVPTLLAATNPTP